MQNSGATLRSPELYERVLGYLREYVTQPQTLKGSDRLYHDLGLAGDDAWEFFATLSKEFEISQSQFDLRDYFPDEFQASFLWIKCLFRGRASNRWPPMTVNDVVAILATAIAAKAST